MDGVDFTEIKQSQSSIKNDENKYDKRSNYTPLPNDIEKNKNRISMGKVRHKYRGEGSEGNKFVGNLDL